MHHIRRGQLSTHRNKTQKSGCFLFFVFCCVCFNEYSITSHNAVVIMLITAKVSEFCGVVLHLNWFG